MNREQSFKSGFRRKIEKKRTKVASCIAVPCRVRLKIRVWIQEKLWFCKCFDSFYLKYAREEEPAARHAYTSFTGIRVVETGLCVNNDFPYLGASPDGLIVNTDNAVVGLIKIKGLKIFKDKTICEVTKDHSRGKFDKKCLSRQRFTIDSNNNLHLKKNHAYYYQVQLQLLVTRLEYCDFVFHTPKGQPYVERIFTDYLLQDNIKRCLTYLWRQVLMPEYVEMRIPRNLPPFTVYNV